MTICIGAICDSGKSLIVTSDSMITNESLSIQFEHTARKMTELSDSCIALTAGDALAHTELFNMAQGAIARLKSPSVFDIVDTIKESYQHIRMREINERILNPRGFENIGKFYEMQRGLVGDIAMSIQNQIDRYDYGLEILIAGMNGKSAHIYGISDPGTSECFDAIGFQAIGSGLTHAINTLLARDCNTETPLEDALMIVYEAKKVAEKAPGVGQRITDISILNNSGIVEIPRKTITELHNIYEQWVRKDEKWKNNLATLIPSLGKK